MELRCYRCGTWDGERCGCADGQTLFHGDCREVAPRLTGIALVASDPPYGIDHDTDYTRFSGGHDSKNYAAPIVGDVQDFDPSPWLDYPRAVLFGFNCFSHKLPIGSVLIWCKRRDSKLGVFMGDCELAWMNKGHGVYLKRYIWDGHDRESERGEHFHPTQKPVDIMQWCIESAGQPGTVLDPFCGSGTTLVACKQLGRRGIGIEIEEKYVEIAASRLRQNVLQFGDDSCERKSASSVEQANLFPSSASESEATMG